MRKHGDFSGIGYAIFFVIAVIILVGVGLASCTQSVKQGFERREEIGTVTDKGIKRSKGIKRYGDDDKYLVYTKDENGNSQVFEITDNILAGRFNSSDVYAEIEIGKTYKFTVGGSRNQVMSWYPNIYSFEEVKNE